MIPGLKPSSAPLLELALRRFVVEVALNDRRNLNLNSPLRLHSWANESDGRSAGSRHDSEIGFEENMSDGYGADFENDVWAIAIFPASECQNMGLVKVQYLLWQQAF